MLYCLCCTAADIIADTVVLRDKKRFLILIIKYLSNMPLSDLIFFFLMLLPLL